jgi:hypothetical protein
VTDSHFEKATQNPTQQGAAEPGNASHFTAPELQEPQKNAESQCFQGLKDNPARTRNTPKNTGKTASFKEVGAISGASAIQSGALWADIRALIEACPDLSPASRFKLIAIGDGDRDEQQVG